MICCRKVVVDSRICQNFQNLHFLHFSTFLTQSLDTAHPSSSSNYPSISRSVLALSNTQHWIWMKQKYHYHQYSPLIYWNIEYILRSKGMKYTVFPLLRGKLKFSINSHYMMWSNRHEQDTGIKAKCCIKSPAISWHHKQKPFQNHI